MFTLRKLLLSDRMRLIMMFVFFLVFVFFSVQFIIDQTEWLNRIIIAVIALFFSFFFVLSEILKYIYKVATKHLVLNCDPDLAIKDADKLAKYDMIKGYKNPLLVFYTLVYMDQGNFEQLEKHIENPVFQTSSNLKLVYNYNKFYLAIHHDDFDQATEYFRLITAAYKVKTKRRYAVKPIYSLSMITADYYLLKKNMTKAEEGLRNVDPNFLNPREKSYYYISYAKFLKAKGHQKEINYLKDAQDIAPKLAHVKNYV
jgi:hypothetical protein